MFQGQTVLACTEPFTFEYNKTLGWQCKCCNLSENIPVLVDSLTSLNPIAKEIIWKGCVRILQIHCKVCQCYGRLDTFHQMNEGDETTIVIEDGKVFKD